MRIIGLDVGTRTIGVAVSDPLGLTAQGVTTIRRRDIDRDMQALADIIREYEAEQILIGLPLNMNGTAGPSVDMAKELGAEAESRLGLPVIYRDERLSTVAAGRTLLEGDVSRKKRKQVIDKMAAVFVLQGYLDYLRNQG
ncbi:MAG: Holliday junction resolvase RuvX [Firmicutes bacterium]|nr:Holliday junction resolvase RuvX [Bacillota bacterium]